MALMTQQISFMKMHGLGNDFVIVDSRGPGPLISEEMARRLGNRHLGVGFDQLAVISDSPQADVALTFFNADGSTAGACGNATRCVAQYEMQRLGRTTLSLITERGILQARQQGALVSVNMGHPMLNWDEVPLAREMDTLHLPLEGQPTATGMGNPHCVFIVEDAEAIDVAREGAIYEHHPLFPQRTNVEFIQIIDRSHIRMRVWERGGMITLACGSGACAAAVVAHRMGLTERCVDIALDGGVLNIDWREDGVWMTGPTAHVFDGVLSAEMLALA